MRPQKRGSMCMRKNVRSSEGKDVGLNQPWSVTSQVGDLGKFFNLSELLVLLSLFKIIYFGCTGSSLLLRLFSSFREQRLLSSYGCSGFSLLQNTGSRAFGLGGCGGLAQLPPQWDPPGPGIEPMSPAFVGGFFTTKPPGKP